MKKRTSLITAMLFILIMNMHAQSKNELMQQIGALNFQLQQANETIARMQKEIDELKAQLETSTKPKLMDYRDSIDYVIDTYLMTDNVDDRAQFVMEPERIKPLMTKWYNGIVPSKKRTKNNVTYQKINDKVYWSDDFYLIKTNDGYKIDWEATVCYNPLSVRKEKVGEMPLNEIFELRGTISEASPSSYNAESYSGYNFIDYYTNDSFNIFCVLKNSLIDKQLKI